MTARRKSAEDARTLVTLLVDGQPVEARQGEPIATALLCAGLRVLRRSPREGAPRGAFCFMGVCQECVIDVDGARVQACITPVREGMVIRLGGEVA